MAVGLSGGVDSAVSVLLLKRAGFDVVGVHLYCWPPKSEVEKDGLTREEWIRKNGCRADEDKQAALKTALELGIPFKILDFSEEYNKRVVDYFYREYEMGRTPNPDVLCNSEVKFGLFLDWSVANGFDYVATGHYAKSTNNFEPEVNITSSSDEIILPAQNFSGSQGAESHSATLAQRALRNPAEKDVDSGSIKLFIPKDKHKDQTYFLWKLTEKELKHVLFPLGDLEKSGVRKIAKDAGLSVAGRPDSQGICFVGNVDARKFLARRLSEKKGEVKNVRGEIIGTHRGIWFYTIGQRGGWNLTAKAQKEYVKDGATPVFYVISKDAKKNELIVGIGKEAESQKFMISEMNWIEGTEKISFVRIRHGGKLIPVSLFGNEVIMREPQRGVAPGQSAVFYSKNGEVVGGGVIS